MRRRYRSFFWPVVLIAIGLIATLGHRVGRGVRSEAVERPGEKFGVGTHVGVGSGH